jgi:hypothetical protein
LVNTLRFRQKFKLEHYPAFRALAISLAGNYALEMSAAELLEQVKALPLRERQKFVLAVLKLEEASASHASSKAKRVKWPDVELKAIR